MHSNLASSLTIVAPVSIGASIMVSAATLYPPALVALFAAVGGCLGELSGYYAGSLGKKVAIPEVTSASRRKRRKMSGRFGASASNTFTAYRPGRRVCVASYTSPMPPAPTWRTTR